MVELAYEIAHLVFEVCDFAVALSQLLLLSLQVVRLLIDQPVQLFHLIEAFRDFKFEVANVIAEVVALVSLDLVCHIKAVDLFEVLTVTLSQRRQLFVRLTFLRLQTSVGVLGDLELVLDTLDVDVTI